MEGRSCETPGCDQPAKLQCPTCIKLGIQVLRSLAIMGPLPICESSYREKERESEKVMERKQGLQEILNSECREAFSVISSASRLTGTYTRSFSCLIRNLSECNRISQPLLNFRRCTSWQRETLPHSLPRKEGA